MASNDNLAAYRKLTAVAGVLATLPTRLANYYANGGDGVGQGVVGDRFQGLGNSRFVPLSYDYFRWKQGQSKKLNKLQKEKYGKGSRLIKDVPFKARGSVVNRAVGSGSNLPILVLSGKMRAAIIGRKHPIVQQGDTAIISFVDLPEYALFHQTGTKNMPRRSPVDPDASDMQRVYEYGERVVNAAIGQGSQVTSFGQGVPRIL